MTDTPTRDSIAKALSLFDEEPDTNGVVVNLGDLRALVAERDALETEVTAVRVECETIITQAAMIRKRATSRTRQQYARGLSEAAKAIRAALSDQKGGG